MFDRKQYMRTYRKTHKEQKAISDKKYRETQKGKDTQIRERIKCKSRYKKYMKKYSKRYYQLNKHQIDADVKKRTKRYLSSWKDYIPSETNCEICKKKIYFDCKDTKYAIHFDHKFGGSEAIKYSPFNWLQCHLKNDKNLAIWESCNFGMLCGVCNRSLPTKNREQFLLNAAKYMNISLQSTNPLNRTTPYEG